jgi:hypothetical protein
VSTPVAASTAARHNIGRSIWAVLAGFLVVIALSLGTDEVLHLLHVYPPWNEPMGKSGLYALALSYRLVYDTLGSYLTAKLAPYAPVRHAMIGGAIGLVVGALGVLAATKENIGPLWYPIALALSSLITAWIGGQLFARSNAERAGR